MFDYIITDHKNQYIKTPRSLIKFINARIVEYYVKPEYGRDFMEEMIECDLIIKYGYGVYHINIL